MSYEKLLRERRNSGIDKSTSEHNAAQRQIYDTISPANRKEVKTIANSDESMTEISSSSKEVSSVSKSGNLQGYGGACSGETHDSYKELRRLSSENGAAFCTKRSSRFEYVEPEEDEELQEELRKLMSKRELEAIQEDAVKEVATIIDNIDAELEDDEGISGSFDSGIRTKEGRTASVTSALNQANRDHFPPKSGWNNIHIYS